MTFFPKKYKPSPERPLRGGVDLLAAIIASVFGAGFSPVASGTAGSLVVPAAALLISPENASLWLAVALPIVTVLGIWAAGRCEAFWGGDPGRVVIDEVAGMLVALLMLPITMPVLVAAFFLFRFFDIVKPQPARWAEGLPGGWGIMADDLIAGLYAHLSLRLLILFVPAMTTGVR